MDRTSKCLMCHIVIRTFYRKVWSFRGEKKKELEKNGRLPLGHTLIHTED